MKLTSNFYRTTAKIVKVMLNLVFTVPAIEMLLSKNFGTPVAAKPNTESAIIYCNNYR